MAEGLFNHHGKNKIITFSAGSFPTGKVHPMSLSTLEKHGMSRQNYRSKSWDEFKDENIDIVITVCDNAAGETCPIFPTSPVKAHWGVPDPAHFKGTPAEIEAEFERVFSLLEKRIKTFLLLPLETINKEELQQKLHKIGTL
jgi:arsenate reductase